MTRYTLLAVAAHALTAALALAGPHIVEDFLIDEAGPLPAAAMVANDLPGDQPVLTISGMLTGVVRGSGPAGDFEDMFLIRIDDPAGFSATTDATFGVFGTDFDTQLFLFSYTGRGKLANDNETTFSAGKSAIPAGSLTSGPGLYYLAISGLGNDPLSAGGSIFTLSPPTEVSGPDGPGGADPITGWTGVGDTGTYTILLSGARFVPEPGSLALLLIGGFAAIRRRA